MYRYLLDTNVVVVFQKAGCLDALVNAAFVAITSVKMAMVDDVYDELTVPKPGKPKTAEMIQASAVIKPSKIQVEEISVGSTEDAIRTSLLSRTKGKPGAGEAASVAFAVARHDHIMVTADRKAVAGAAKLYAELPGEVGRILGVHAFLRTLVDWCALDLAIARRVSDMAYTASNLDPPLWWVTWSVTPRHASGALIAMLPAGQAKRLP
jgi:predicted nucleic acid-binding protein